MEPQLFVAFDGIKHEDRMFPDMHDLSDSGEPFGIKVNLDAILHPFRPLKSFVGALKDFNRPLFADLKMWNGSRTMESVVKTFVDLGVDFLNIWAFADKEMEKAVKAAEGSNTKILGLTVLSHYDDADCQKWFNRTLREAVADFTAFALGAGCHGIIVPGTMLDVVKDLQTIKVATGVRPSEYRDDRHKQEATPAEVARGGAHYAVCGSPILKQPTAEAKIAALRRIIHEMRRAVT